MGEIIEVVTPSGGAASHGQRTLPIREDCWSEEATSTLVEAWGSRYLELNRGNLRQKDWQEVADAVNSLHGHSKKTHRTDVQCKNRIDTIKKKYKVEKARHASSGGTLTSSWPFFERMDALIGSTFPVSKKAGNTSPSVSPSPPMALPLKRILGSADSLPRKRIAPPGDDGGFFRRNYSAMAAAAAADTDSEEDPEEEVEEEMEEEEEEAIPAEKADDGLDGMKRLVQAIERFGEVYEKVEREKLRQMVDLEKQRMKFAKDLEMERMKIFTETQIQLERIKKGAGSGGGGGGKIHQQYHRPTLGSNGEKDY